MSHYPKINKPVDVSESFKDTDHQLFIADNAASYDAASGNGQLNWLRHAYKMRLAFSQAVRKTESAKGWEFPPGVPDDFKLPFQLSLISERTIRLRLSARTEHFEDHDSLMLVTDPVEKPGAWHVEETEEAVIYQSEAGQLKIEIEPFRLSLYDAEGQPLTTTLRFDDLHSLYPERALTTSFVRRVDNLQRHIALSLKLAPNENIFGGGESFTKLDKHGQKMVLATCDAHGVLGEEMYKPVPFFMSSRGYGFFVHTSTPVTADFGHDVEGVTSLTLGDDELDIFFFLGNPKEILSEYTTLTGRSPMPPLWSFGLWMSRITYKSEQETRQVADRLRQEQIPCDVIHLDTGWFETEWCCDYEFSQSRFDDPKTLLSDLRAQGFRVSLWQLPYFTQLNPLFAEIIEKGLAIKGLDHRYALDEAILDFSLEEAVTWYQSKLKALFDLGVAAIKVDFGEAAPYDGLYASGHSGWHEHNLYPLRYNKVVAEITEATRHESIIWARSAWTGSQRYPIHWGGDAENTDAGMLASLRGGLCLGLCGFSFWSHDIGGFVTKSPEEIYLRWLPFGMLTSHSRCHGFPPKEPWEYNAAFVEAFRDSVALKYRLMPYIYAQATLASKQGYPLLRPLFFDYPDDPGAWLIEDQYLLGEDLLVAPLFEEAQSSRSLYLPPGQWIDYQTGQSYDGAQWYHLASAALPIIILARAGAVIPRCTLAQSTDDIDWGHMQALVVAEQQVRTEGYGVTQEGELYRIVCSKDATGWQVIESHVSTQWDVLQLKA